MSRLSEIEPGDAQPDARRFYEQDLKLHGEILKTTKVYARRPTILAGMRELSAGVARSGLIEPALQALVCVRVAGINRCPF